LELVGGLDLRSYLRSDFFETHLKHYTKSRRSAPVYLPLSASSAEFTVWVDAQRISRDTLFTIQSELLAPKLRLEEARLADLQAEARTGDKSRKQIEKQETIVEELRGFADEVRRVAPLWQPNIDDGTVINFAPLWRLMPRHSGWQKELKSAWDALCAGGYDWAHLAMHLWPELVVSKCASDRSFAIAHGLEDVFWIKVSDGKWIGRKTPTRPVQELVRERTSPSVKSAVKSLLEAPVATGNGGGGRRGRRRSVATTKGVHG
jgi:hypothetical protein